MTIAPSIPFRMENPDRLLNTFKVILTEEQLTFIRENKTTLRTPLTKQFNLKFSTKYSKLQLTRVIEIMDIPEPKPKSPSQLAKFPRPDVPHERNVHWVTEQGVWAVRFKKDGKITHIGRYKEVSEAVQVAEEYRNNLA